MPAAEWELEDLTFYNIIVHEHDAATFFGPNADLHPTPTVPIEFLSVETSREALAPPARRLLRYMEKARLLSDYVAVDDFLVRLLDTMGFLDAVGPDAIFAPCRPIPVTVGGLTSTFRAMCAADADHGDLPLLVHAQATSDPPAQVHHSLAPLIAAAIGAYQSSAMLAHATAVVPVAEPPHDRLTPRDYAGILFTGALPTFFKISVTPQLARAVAEGTPCVHPTVVQVYAPAVTSDNGLQVLASGIDDSMRSLKQRKDILEAYEGFKRHVVSRLRPRSN
jgi:hypothetical protein